jgi:hypothetical protein
MSDPAPEDALAEVTRQRAELLGVIEEEKMEEGATW